MPDLRLPLATYRIQFSLAFRFVDGRDLVPYLNDLGITDLYSSPRFKARRGSPHAYDVADPSKINSELGTEEEYQELAGKLRSYSMGLLLDIVPNHMATTSDNPWWMDLLENGRASMFAAHFAVDWGRGSAKARRRARILLPILGDLYGNVLARGEISLKLDEKGFYAKYYEKRLPLDPKSYGLILQACVESARGKGAVQAAAEIERLLPEIEALPAAPQSRDEKQTRHDRKEQLKRDVWAAYNGSAEFKAELDECLLIASGIPDDPESFDALDRILDEQHYRVAYWRTAAEELNYRRFFDITDLVGIRVEDPEVFDARHAEILALTRTGDVTGLRVDHIDGLWDPLEYLERLRARVLDTPEGATPPECAGFYVVVEKILGGDEELPVDWKVCGTTGYDYLNWLNGVFVDPAGLAKLDSFYRRFTGVQQTMGEMQYERKKQVVELLFPGELRALGYHLGRLAAIDRVARICRSRTSRARYSRRSRHSRSTELTCAPWRCPRATGSTSSRHWRRRSRRSRTSARRYSRS
jgi:(1->4)-alpha-D-glucan 1-alpha-D-glucosylmutase